MIFQPNFAYLQPTFGYENPMHGNFSGNYLNAAGSCGKRPTCILSNSKNCKRKEDDYDKCMKSTGDAANKQADAILALANAPTPTTDSGSNTMLYVGVGAAVLVVGVIIFVVIRKKK